MKFNNLDDSAIQHVLIIIGGILLALALNALEAWIVTKLVCFIFTLTYTSTLFLKVWAGLIIIQTVLGYAGRRR